MRLKYDKLVEGRSFLLDPVGDRKTEVVQGCENSRGGVYQSGGMGRIWIAQSKAHAVEFLKINSWEEFQRMMNEAEKARKKAEEAKVQESAKEAS